MAKAAKSEIRLGRLELRIMNIVWTRDKATVHQVRGELSKGRKPAYSTVLTMMRKLEAKGYLKHEVDDRTYVYEPAISRQVVRHSLLSDLVDRLFEGSSSLLLTSLVEQGRISDQELQEIQKLVRKRSVRK
jgi:BlaI family penicillinase repressor